MSGEIPFQPSPGEMETSAQREMAYQQFSETISSKFSQEAPRVLTWADRQVLHLKSTAGRPFYVERATPNTDSTAKTRIVMEESKSGYDYSATHFQIGADGTVTKESFSRRSTPEAKPEGQGGYEDSQMKFNREGDAQMRHNKEMDERLETTPPQPLSAQETDQLTELVSQSSAA